MKDKCVLLDRYEISGIVGEGSYSIVFKGYDRQAKRSVAVKKLKLTGLTQEEKNEAEELFFREIEMLKKLEHPGIPKYYDFFIDYDHFFLVMEWIMGEDLASILKRKRRLSQNRVLKIMKYVIDVLVYLQDKSRGIIYKDLKPSNIMLLNDSDEIKIIDFGTARRFTPDKDKDTLSLGTPGYAPPEAYNEHTDLSSDIYSFGATFYHLVTGEEPFQFKFKFPDPRKFIPELNEEVAKLLLNCLKERKLRIQDAFDLKRQYENAMKDSLGVISFSFKNKNNYEFIKVSSFAALVSLITYYMFTASFDFVYLVLFLTLSFSLYVIIKSLI